MLQTPSDLLRDVSRFLPHIGNYAPREAQMRMSDCVAEFLAASGDFVCEAGTGIGKTLAYLVPILQAGGRTILTTGTRTLQDQLYLKDLPVARAVTASSAYVTVLKGRSNYFCRYRYEQASSDLQLTAQSSRELEALRHWAAITETGDVSEATHLAETAAVWPFVTSTVDNCLVSQCPAYEDCFLYRARQRAFAADIVVINHHLLLSELALRRANGGEILPNVDAVVCDEAHQLPDLAAQFFGIAVSSRQLTELCRDSLLAGAQCGVDTRELTGPIGQLELVVRSFRDSMRGVKSCAMWSTFADRGDVVDGLHATMQALTHVGAVLDQLVDLGTGLAHCAGRAHDLVEKLNGFGRVDDSDWTHWVEVSAYGFVMHGTPLDVSDAFQTARRTLAASWMFTSATMAIGDDLQYFCRRLGIQQAVTASWPSPFDYRRQSLLYFPPILYEPADSEFLPAILREAVAVLMASRGRAFFLFTSHRALRYAATNLPVLLPAGFRILAQGSKPKSALLDDFRRTDCAVLLGSMSFWEGVDVRGPALSCVIIDKLPFATPDHPVLQARIQNLKARGVDPFTELQLPDAILLLKQGAGRLIRDDSDRGVLMICDPRLLTRYYGERFLAALPPMRRTHELPEVERFLQNL